MVEQLIWIIVCIVVFASITYLAFWICDKSGFPPPVKWLVGAILLIVLLLFAAGQIGVGPGGIHLSPR